QKFGELSERIRRETGDTRTPEEVAEGFLTIAVDNMANAIKKISIQRGHDVSRYVLNCFGGAGGQHACLVADALGIERVCIHPYAGVLSAYGMGLAEIRVMRERAIEQKLTPETAEALTAVLDELEAEGRAETEAQGIDAAHTEAVRKVHLRYEGTDSALVVDHGTSDEIVARFEKLHRQRFGFVSADKGHIVEAVSVEVIGATEKADDPILAARAEGPTPNPIQHVEAHFAGESRRTPIYDRDRLL